MHVRGYKEKGNINTPLDLAIQNQIDRFSLAIDVIDRVPSLQRTGGHAKERLRNMQIECQNYAYEHGVTSRRPTSGRPPSGMRGLARQAPGPATVSLLTRGRAGLAGTVLGLWRSSTT
jgi:hypothetical protein